MALPGAVPRIVVLALGTGALGGPDALRLLVELAGRNPVVDIGICVFVLAIIAAQLLGTALLSRFVRKAPGARRAADPFAKVTLLLSLAVVSGGLGLLVDLAAKYYHPVVVPAAAVAALVYVLRVLSQAWNARGAAHGERATTTRRTARSTGLHFAAAAACALVAIPLAALRLLPGFNDMPIAVATVVVGAALVVLLSRTAPAATAPLTRGASAG